MTIAPVIHIRARIPIWSIPERLRKVRREMGLTHAAFAALLGVNASRYSAWEAGRNKPDMLALSESLENVTGVSKFWFRGDIEGDPSGPDNGSRLGDLNSRPSHYE